MTTRVPMLHSALRRMGAASDSLVVSTDRDLLNATLLKAAQGYYGRTYTVAPPAGTHHTGSVVFCHGLGDTGQGWAEMMQGISPLLPGVRFVLPTAANIPVTLNGGMQMPAWYDILGPGGRFPDDTDGMQCSAVYIRALLDVERKSGVPVVVAGFSQGAALSLFVALTSEADAPLAGVAVLSGYLHSKSSMGQFTDVAKTVPMLMCHGLADEVVAVSRADSCLKEITLMGRPEGTVALKKYKGMGHSSSPEEERDFIEFLRNVFTLKTKL